MKLSEICVKRPVFTIVLSLVLMVVGLMSYQHLEVRYAPKILYPQVFVHTQYTGASAKVVEQSVTTPLEESIASVPDIESLSSHSRDGESNIRVKFLPTTEYNFLAEVDKVRNAVSGTRHLPDDIETPTVRTADSDGQMLMNIFVQDPKMTPLQIQDYINRYLKNPIQEISGVAQVNVFGGGTYAMRIWLKPDRLAAYDLTAQDVGTALQANNFSLPSGQLISGERMYTLNSDTLLKNINQFKQMIVSKPGNPIVRLDQVADIKLGNQSLTPFTMLVNNKPGAGLMLIADPNANPMETSRAVRKRLAKIQAQLPASMKARVGVDMTTFLKLSIDEVYLAILEALLLVALVVYLFLGSLRSALIPVVTIPVCLVGVFAIMWSLGFTINIMTLLAMVLGIGLVVDDAIVMLENIQRHIEEGMAPFKAAIKGSREIGFAVIAMTLTLVAVYAPIGLMSGVTASLFREFAFTLAGSVLISGFVALTLSPMLCARVLHERSDLSRFERWLEHTFERISLGYKNSLSKALNLKWFIVTLFVLLALAGYGLSRTMPSTFIPKEDVGIAGVGIDGATDASLAAMVKAVKTVNKQFTDSPVVQQSFSFIGGFGGLNDAFTMIVLKPWQTRHKTTQAFVNALNKKLANLPSVQAQAFNFPPPIIHEHSSGNVQSAIQLKVMTSNTFDALLNSIDLFKAAMKKYPGLTNVSTDLNYDSQQFNLQVDRGEAAQLGITPQQVAQAIQTMMGGEHVTDFDDQGQSYYVMLQMQEKDLKNLSDLDKIYLRNADNKMVPLADVVSVKPSVSLDDRPHYNQLRAAEMSAEIAPGYNMGQVINYLQQMAPTVLPSDTKIEFSGVAKRFLESNHNMLVMFGLALVFIYLVLAALFESFVDPFIVLLTVPLCIVGALLTLRLTGGSLNLYTQVGLVTLIGLVSKHGILITQFANDQLAAGKSKFGAVVAAAKTRLRPILMTTATMVFGALPLAFAFGPGSVSRSQIGWVIVGGLLFGSFFSLVVVPTAYMLFKRRL